jgi:hypothetical protein
LWHKGLRHIGWLQAHLTGVKRFDQMRHFGKHLIVQADATVFDHVLQMVT